MLRSLVTANVGTCRSYHRNSDNKTQPNRPILRGFCSQGRSCGFWGPAIAGHHPPTATLLQRWSQYLPPHLSLNHFLEADCPSAWLERRELVSRWEQQCRQGTSLSFRAHWPHPTVRPSPQLPTVHPALVLLAILLFCCLFLSPRAQTVAGRSDGRSSRVGFIWTTAFGNV